ncbi:MAG: hypothetical protein J1F66_02910 [Clostridiales bacterium]|nr:hypothetical protein [Clostridiales bacterium]
MQWNKENKYQQPQEDVYADVKTAFSGNGYAETDNQEFSLENIQRKLGAFYGTEDQEVVSTSSSPDLMPSNQTIRMSYQREYALGRTRSASKLSTKQKVMIASYVMVVLALIIGISLCSVYVGGAFGSAVVLDASYSDLSEQIAKLNTKIGAEDYETLTERATELGYIDSTKANTKNYTEVETRPAQNFEVETNWFDSLCDWLCNAFGG